jgi:hypothetical protein
VTVELTGCRHHLRGGLGGDVIALRRALDELLPRHRFFIVGVHHLTILL